MQSKDDPRPIQEAKKYPNGWVYVFDEEFPGKDEVPPPNIKGAWKVGAKGEIIGDFIPNPKYKVVK